MTVDNPALWSAIQGPVIMITVGTLFALDQYGVLQFHESWPVILIVVGVLQLSRWNTKRRP
jgi:hypothetical protein